MADVNLRPPLKSDSRSILEWRNSPEVRRLSLSQDFISLSVHEKWFEDRLTRIDAQPFWMIEFQGDTVGMVRFDLTGNFTFEISILLSEESRGQGVGAESLRLAISALQELFPGSRLIARIDPNNLISIKLFESCEFVRRNNSENPLVFHYKSRNYRDYPL